MAKRKPDLLKLWKIRQEAEGYDVSDVNTLEEAEHFFDNNSPKKAEKLAEQSQDEAKEPKKKKAQGKKTKKKANEV